MKSKAPAKPTLKTQTRDLPPKGRADVKGGNTYLKYKLDTVYVTTYQL